MDCQITRLLPLPAKSSFFLFGPRQVGKSTLIKALFPKTKALYFNLLDRELITSLRRSLKNFREAIIARDKDQVTHVIVDEIQKLPELLDEVHFIMEEMNRPPFFILSGSSARKLKQSGVNMLGGRALSLRLGALSHKEIEAMEEFKDDNFPLVKILKYGTLPDIFTEFDQDLVKLKLKSYYDTYIKEEIRIEALVRNLDAFSIFLEMAAEDNGNLINYSNLAQDTGVSHVTIKEYYQILIDTLMGFYLRPYTKSKRKRLVKSPKFYFFDTGVVRTIQGSLSLDLDYGTDEFGRCFEHFLIREIILLSSYANKDYSFYFYRTEAGAEVDLIVEKPNEEILAIEIKSNSNPKLKNLRGLKSFQSINPQAKLYCVSLAKHRREESGILILPWREIFAELDL
ncbi:MAG: ATP-binding protein [Candidatus Melainabacteria bacterium]|jgi:uncharacterized protein|nr:ATP-binding protein [Candidatus Melainabacteria bacterium]